jgi:3-methyladenine DNA glycosylase AlkC
MSLVKDIYSPAFYNSLANDLGKVLPAFDKEQFISGIFTDAFQTMEWKERMKHTTLVLHQFLPADFPKAVTVILKLIDGLRKNRIPGGLAFAVFPDYVETYGLDDLKSSVAAFESITQFITCEFAVRPFIIKYEKEMIGQMVRWSQHTSDAVRRLASEGSRPRLPWAMAIPFLKKDPSAILPILDNLKNDASESVRRSVANNLNDISKDHPDLVIKIAKEWKGLSKETDAILKHANRTLLKQGHPEVLASYGLNSEGFTITDFKVATPKVSIGNSLEFSLTMQNTGAVAGTLRLEYGIYYKKANGQLARKVFKLSEKIYKPTEVFEVQRKQSFKLITTRKFYTGDHKISIIVNGIEKVEGVFELIG